MKFVIFASVFLECHFAQYKFLNISKITLTLIFASKNFLHPLWSGWPTWEERKADYTWVKLSRSYGKALIQMYLQCLF